MTVGLRRVSALLASATVVFALLFYGETAAQTEKDLLEQAAVKLKAGKTHEAIDILEQAQKKYPLSAEIAETRLKLYEKTKADTELVIDACGTLADALKHQEVEEGKLTGRTRSLLKKTEKKLDELLKTRREVDTAVKEFVAAGMAICQSLAEQKKLTEASYAYQRLGGLEPGQLGLEKEFSELAAALGGNAALLKRPAAGPDRGNAEVKKLLREARIYLRRSKLDEARISCKGALEIDPNMIDAFEILSDIAAGKKDPRELLTYGLGYLLFPAHEQSADRVDEIAKKILDTSPELGMFFENTERAAVETCDAVDAAMKKRNSSDAHYALLRLGRLSPATKNLESTLKKAQVFFKGIMPWHQVFDGTDLSRWGSVSRIGGELADRCMFIPQDGENWTAMVYTGARVSESFTFRFSFRIERTAQAFAAGGDVSRPGVFIVLWAEQQTYGGQNAATINICNDKSLAAATLRKRKPAGDATEIVQYVKYGGPILDPGKWYTITVEYKHQEKGASTIDITLDGKKLVAFSVPEDVFPGRTGYVGMGQQLFKSGRFKDIYLVP